MWNILREKSKKNVSEGLTLLVIKRKLLFRRLYFVKNIMLLQTLKTVCFYIILPLIWKQLFKVNKQTRKH